MDYEDEEKPTIVERDDVPGEITELSKEHIQALLSGKAIRFEVNDEYFVYIGLEATHETH